jgi:hypothetical protein
MGTEMDTGADGDRGGEWGQLKGFAGKESVKPKYLRSSLGRFAGSARMCFLRALGQTEIKVRQATRLETCVCVCVFVWCVCVCVCVSMLADTHMHPYTHTHTHPYRTSTCTCTNILVSMPSLKSQFALIMSQLFMSPEAHNVV